MDAIPAIASKPVAVALMQVAALTKRYRDEVALAEVSFDIQAGEVLGLIGPNGAGKTTLLETIAGVLPADGGSICWRGAPLSLAHRREVVVHLRVRLRRWVQQYVGGLSHAV